MSQNRLSRWLSVADDDAHSVGLVLLCGTVAALVTSPLLWLFWHATEVDPDRAAGLVASSTTVEILLNSVALTALVTGVSIVLGVALAVLTTRTDLPARRFWSVVVALPLVVPSYIGAFAFVAAFGPHGEFGSLFGASIPRIDGFWGATLIITLYTYPYVFLTTRAALLSMDGSLVEAARTLNTGRFEAFRRVTLPQIRPAVGAGSLLVALYAISDFGTPAFMGVSVFTREIFIEFDTLGGSVDYAALLSLQLLAVVAVILAIEARIGRDPGTVGSDASAATIELGVWRWPAVGAIALLGVVTLVVPVAIFLGWLVRGTGGTAVPALEFQWEFALNSVTLATLAAVAAAVFAIPVAYHSARSDTLLARLFERATYVGFAVPGIVIGLALVFLGTRSVPWLYRTVPLLVFAYVVRFLPQAVGIVRTSVLQVDEQLVEAARTLNAGRLSAFRRVTLPLIAPGVVAGGALVFLTTMKELPATLMLQPIGMETLVTIVWNAHAGVRYEYAALPALLLVVISGLSMVILLRQEDYSVN